MWHSSCTSSLFAASHQISASAEKKICMSSSVLWETISAPEATFAACQTPYRTVSVMGEVTKGLCANQRDYICEYCARAFKSSHNLAVHRMIHTGEKPLQCEICGFTCRQKASLNWHMKKHDADTFYQFSCNICGKKFEKKDSVVAHKAKSHPEVLIAEALAANAGALITSTEILGTNPESVVPPTDGQGLPLLPDPLGNTTPGECLLLNPDGMPKAYCSGGDRVNLMADGKIFVGTASGESTEGLVMNTEILGATTEVLIEDSDSTGP
uniref:E3 ubiquitin-protein ligase ZFP91 n=1 Tax=Podarcis muralis TaxID=64176 RepID=A0A670HPD3_PODMU